MCSSTVEDDVLEVEQLRGVQLSLIGEVRPDKSLRVLSSEVPHNTMILRIKAKEATFLAQH